MATASVTYTFSGGGNALASEVNTNFTQLVSFLNASVVQVDGSQSMTGQLTLLGSDPASNNHAARKLYVDTKGQQSIATTTNNALTAGTYNNGTGSAIVTVVDPGYNIWLYGSAIACFVSQAQTTTWSIWGISIYVDGVQKDQLMIPFSVALVGQPLSIGLPLRHTAHATGTNATVQVIMNLISGDGSLVLNASSPRNNLEVNYVRQ